MADQQQGSKQPLNEFVNHQRKAAEETYKAFASLIPPEFRTHSRIAQDEFLKSFQVLIQGTADALDREMNRRRTTPGGSDGGPSTTGKSKIKVDVS